MPVEQKSVGASVSARAHAELVRKVRHLREDLAETQRDLDHSPREVDELREKVNWLSSFDVVNRCLRALGQGLHCLDSQLDVLMRMQMPAARPSYLAQAPSYQPEPGHDMA